MKSIKEFDVNGTFEDEPVKGKVTAYVNKKVLTGALILMMTTTFAGCLMHAKAESMNNSNVEQIIEEEKEATGKIKYIVEPGDTLESLVYRYVDWGISSEIEKICQANDIADSNKIYTGQELILEIPISKLESFGYTYTFEEVKEWEAMDYFVLTAFNLASDKVDPNNMVFWRDKQYVVGDFLGKNNSSGIEIGTETPLLMKAASAIYDLEIMTIDQLGFYSEEDIKSKEDKILSYYLEAIEITERNTGKKYGVNFIKTPVVKTIPLEKGLSR